MINLKLENLYQTLGMTECPKEFTGLTLNGYYFPAENPKGVVVISHGMAEHTLRYQELGEYLAASGLTTYAFDYYGHGYSKKEEDTVAILDTNNLIDSILLCMKMIHDYVKSENQNLPMYLLAHSMGSMCAQKYIEINPDDYEKVLLSGTDIGGGKYHLLKVLTGMVMKKSGYNSYNKLIKTLTLDGFDSAFKDEEKELAWLSLNDENIEKYKQDPLCGQEYPVGYFNSLADALNFAVKKENIQKIHAKKILLMSGIEDPVSNFGKSPKALCKKYQSCGLNASFLIIANARHETFNEKEPVKSQVFGTIKDFFLN